LNIKKVNLSINKKNPIDYLGYRNDRELELSGDAGICLGNYKKFRVYTKKFLFVP